MEPDYLPIPEIFVSAMIVPQLDFTIRLCIPGIWGVRGPLLTPGWGCGGQRAPAGGSGATPPKPKIG
jgi:hypothetical protein